MPWLRHRLRDSDVWAKVDDNAALIKDANGRVEIVYKPADGARVYRAGARNLTAAPGSEPVSFEAGEPAESPASEARPAAAGAGKSRGRAAGAAAAVPPDAPGSAS